MLTKLTTGVNRFHHHLHPFVLRTQNEKPNMMFGKQRMDVAKNAKK